MNKTVRLNFRVTEDESAYIQNLSKDSGKSISEVMRQLIRNSMENKSTAFEPKEHFLLNKQLIYEINRIGNNINQIARIANAKGVIDVPHLRKEIDKLDEFIIDMKNKYLRPDKDE